MSYNVVWVVIWGLFRNSPSQPKVTVLAPDIAMTICTGYGNRGAFLGVPRLRMIVYWVYQGSLKFRETPR